MGGGLRGGHRRISPRDGGRRGEGTVTGWRVRERWVVGVGGREGRGRGRSFGGGRHGRENFLSGYC